MNTTLQGRDFLALVQSKMANTIKFQNFTVTKRLGAWVELENKKCRIRLFGYEAERVGFSFCKTGSPEEEYYDLGLYLLLTAPESVDALCPQQKENQTEADWVAAQLQRYNRLMAEGILSAPLQGDFTWSIRYERLEAEGKQLMETLNASRIPGDEALAIHRSTISRKQIVHDPRWLEVARQAVADRSPSLAPP
jgi:hypothetical protein